MRRMKRMKRRKEKRERGKKRKRKRQIRSEKKAEEVIDADKEEKVRKVTPWPRLPRCIVYIHIHLAVCLFVSLTLELVYPQRYVSLSLSCLHMAQYPLKVDVSSEKYQ